MANKRINDLVLRSDFDATCALPVDDPSQSWRVTGAQVLSFIESQIKSTVTSKTSGYTAAVTDNVIKCDASGAGFTIALPAAASVTGKILTIVRTDDTPGNALTIDPNSTELIDGVATRALYTKGECILIQSDGSNWVVLQHKTNTDWSTSLNFTTAGLGTLASSSFSWKRDGGDMKVRGWLVAGTTAASIASIVMPAAAAIRTGALTATADKQYMGEAKPQIASSTNTYSPQALFYDGSTSDRLFITDSISSQVYTKRNGSDILASGHGMTFEFSIPVANWWA